jgi:hypothetical protein
VNPYWNPEQPPPVTKTRSFNSVLPSSSISCFTLFAALSVKISGAGASATAFIFFAPITPNASDIGAAAAAFNMFGPGLR